MKLLSITYVFILVLLGSPISLFSKATDEMIPSKLLSVKDSLGLSREQVILHVANGHLENGKIFFKSYIFSDFYFKGDTSSNVLIVELVDSESNILKTQSHKIIDGVVNGNFELDKKLKPGEYNLRAYTSRMKFNPETYTSKNILIGEIAQNTLNNINSIIKVVPEGGILLNGYENRLIIKLKDDNQFNNGLIGVVLDDENKKVADVQKFGDCLATAILKPKSSGKYRIELTDDYSHTIPFDVKDGYQLQINSVDSEKIKVKARVTPVLKNRDVTLIATLGGATYMKTPLDFKNTTEIDIQLNKDAFPDGIFNFQIKDESNNVMTSRPFMLNRKNLNITANVLTDEEGKIKLKVTDSNGDPVSTKLSVSINPKDKALMEPNSCDRLDVFNLSTNDKQEDFTSIKEKRKELFLADLSVQLLNSDIDLTKSAVDTNISGGLEFNGYAYDFNNKLLRNTEIQVVGISETENMIIETKTDDQGLLSLQNLNLTGESELVFRTKGDNTKERLVKVQQVIIPSAPFEIKEAKISEAVVNRNIRPSKTNRLGYIDDENLIELDEVQVADKKIDNYYTPSNYTLPPTARRGSTKFQDYERPKSIPLLISELPGAAVSFVDPINASVVVRASAPLFMIDGILLPKPNKTNKIKLRTGLNEVMDLLQPGDVHKIELIIGADAAIFGTDGAEGVIAITTRNGSEYDFINRKEAKLDFKGYQPNIDFNNYYHEISKSDKQKLKLLYWNPNLETDENGEAIITLDASEDVTNINLRAYTITAQGISGKLEKTF